MRAWAVGMAIGLTIAGREARAESSFQVNPTLVSLSKESPAHAVVITNHGSEALRVQVNATTWREDAEGVMQLAPTSDIVVRPSLLEIEPGRSKTLRVGTTLGTPAVEGSYRLFVEQLPDRRTVEGGKIVVLTRIGVPVFMAPTKARQAVDAKVAIVGPRAVVEVAGTGTQHVKIKTIVVRAGTEGQTRWERRVVGWYVLPDAVRKFPVDLGGETCRAGEVLTAQLISDDDGPTWTSAPRRCE